MLCPACQRPVAVARPQCLYCGAPLPEEAVTAASAAASAVSLAPAGGAAAAAAASEREIVVAELTGADPLAVAEAFGLSAYEGRQRVRRGGWQLHRILPAEQAAQDAARLAAFGVVVFTIPEAAAVAAAEPERARGGRYGAGVLVLRVGEAELRLTGADLLLMLRAPIVREYKIPPKQRRFRTATLEQGYRFHLHRHGVARPLELDPVEFDFGAHGPLTGSSVLELRRWIEELGQGVPIDDGFRLLPPALAPASGGLPLAEAAGALAGRPTPREDEGPVILDNLAQFRFYSGWRAALERRRRDAAR